MSEHGFGDGGHCPEFISSLSLLDMGSMNYWERFY